LLVANVADAQEMFLGEEPIELADQPWMDKTKTPEERASLIVKAMNWTEKASLVRGRGSVLPYTGHTLAIERLGVP
jgi:beta-glucosidase